MSVTLAAVRVVLNTIIDPNTGASMGAAVKDPQIRIDGGRVLLQIVLVSSSTSTAGSSGIP